MVVGRFLSGIVSLRSDCLRNFCSGNIQVAQFQTASLAEELLSLREGFATFDCGNCFTKNGINVLLSAVCTEWLRPVTELYSSYNTLLFMHLRSAYRLRFLVNL